MDDAEAAQLRRENLYLKQRVAQLEGDLTDVAAETERLRQALERASTPRGSRIPNPLSGGQ